MRPNDYPLDEIAARAWEQMQRGGTIHQKFTCARCRSRQTIDTPNRLFTHGTCEECGHTTDLRVSGCNYLLIRGLKS